MSGLESRYHVSKINDPEGKHESCRYFVLDPQHDKHSVVALKAYAASVKDEFPELATDLLAWIERTDR